MSSLLNLEDLFVFWAFLFQILLILHFALRKWRFNMAMRYGPVVYAMSIPAALISLLMVQNGKAWSLWVGGFLYLGWAIFGFTVEYIKKIQWRTPPRWPIFIPYISLYLATIMFYWWPMEPISRPLWGVYGVLFIISTVLNATSHKRPVYKR